VTERGVTLPEFNFLARERDYPDAVQRRLNRYAEVKGRPKTLGTEFVGDLLQVTGGGKSRDFENTRDHAIIRILRSEGIGRLELLSMVVHSQPAGIIKNPVFELVPLKGARAAGEGRLIVLAPASARAFAVYLRARRHHKLADSDWVWLGTRNRSKLQETGLRLMLVRRAEQAGYTGVTPHQFRHTFSDAWLRSGGPEGDLMVSTAGSPGPWPIGIPTTWRIGGRSKPGAVRATRSDDGDPHRVGDPAMEVSMP
jgi:integrase/recombinase XerD